MSITYDNSVKGQVSGGSITLPSFSVGSNPNSVVLFSTYQPNTLSTPVSSPALDGVAMSGVTSNAGPDTNFGALRVFWLPGITGGSHTLTFSTGFDSTLVSYVIYSYYNVSGIDSSISGQGSFSATFVQQTLTASVNNTLMWGCGGAQSVNGFAPQISGPSNNVQLINNVTMIGAGDFGVQSTPTNEGMSVGGGTATGQGAVALVALLPIIPPAITTPGSFLLNMI